MNILCVVHYKQELDKFKYILPKLGKETKECLRVVAIYDTAINLKNARKWSYQGNLILQECGVPDRPWWYILARHCDDYRFWKKVPNANYYKNRAYKSYPKWVKPLVWLPLGWLKSFYKAPKYVRAHLAKLQPDVVLTTSLAFPPLHIQAEFILEAKRQGIPTISLISNHDALTTKTKIYPVPDYVFCWNDNHKNELIKYHGIKESQIRKVGAWSFEEWIRPNKPTRRDKFCEKYGLNPNKPILTYLTSSNSISGWETQEVEKWRDEKMGNPKRLFTQFVVRPHPDKGFFMSQIEGVRSIPVIAEGVYEPEAFQKALDTYYHSEALYCINTSSALEAMLVGRPVYKIQSNNPETQQKCLHFQQLEPILGLEGPKKAREWLGIGEKLPSELIVEKIFDIIKQ